jgi:Fe/S biogenesis protein NfuA
VIVMTLSEVPVPPASGPLDDMILTVTDAAREKLTELRDLEPEGNRLGVRVEILSDEGLDFTYDLQFQVITKADITDIVRNHGGLRVIIPARDAANLEGAELDFEPEGLVLRNPNRPKPVQIGTLSTDSDLARDVRGVIDDEINPALDAHGGFVTFVGHDDDGKVYLTMGGGCHGCSMSRMTMLQGVQATLKEMVPSVSKVVDVTDHATGENPYYH